MAAVTFSINAVDRTRAAFASINQGLRNLTKGGDAAQSKMLTLGLKLAGVGSIVALVSGRVRKVAGDIESVPGLSAETISSWERLNLLVSESQGVVDQMVANAGEGISSLTSLIRFGWIAATEDLNAAQKDVLETDALAKAMRRDSTGAIDKEIESMRRLSDARHELANINESAGRGIVRRRDEAAAMEKQALGMADQVKRNEKLTEAVRLRIGAERDMLKLNEESAKAQAAAGVSYSKAYGQTLPLRERIEGLRSAYWRTNVELAKYNDLNDPTHIEKRTKIYEDQKNVLDQIDRAFEEQNKLAREVGTTISSSFEDAVFSGGKLRDVVNGLIVDLGKLLFRKMITEPLAGLISGGLSSFFGGGKAVGGPVASGTPYLVGENGPEIFTPSSAGRIIPNHAMSSAAGASGGDTFVFQNSYGAGVSPAQLAPLLRETERRTIATIADMQRRGRPIVAAL